MSPPTMVYSFRMPSRLRRERVAIGWLGGEMFYTAFVPENSVVFAIRPWAFEVIHPSGQI